MSDPIFKIKIEKRFDCYTKISKKNYIYYNLLLNFFSFKNPIAKNKIETFFSKLLTKHRYGICFDITRLKAYLVENISAEKHKSIHLLKINFIRQEQSN